MANPSQYTKALILFQSFETFWTFCQLTEGDLYIKECKQVLKQLISQLNLIQRTDNSIFNSKALQLSERDDTSEIDDVVNALKQWIRSQDRLPYNNEVFKSNFFVGVLFSSIKLYLLKKVDKSIKVPIIWSSSETRFTKSNIRWSAHLPRHMLKNIPQDFETKISSTKTIVVVADIRKSQDLMTYTPSAEYFRERMITFIQKSRDLIKSNSGIFDKFTGDGFLAYFNEEVCKEADLDYISCFIEFAKEQLDFSKKHFSEWTKQIRKLPLGSCGVTIGADIGVIQFKEIEGHLFAIGDAIVWANRVCSAGKTDELIVNNMLYNEIIVDHKVEFDIIESSTKSGETFMAYRKK